MKPSDLELIARKFPISDATRKRNQTDGVPSCPEPERIVHHEPVATEEGKRADPVRHLVRVVSYRVRLCDERNLCEKYFVDALVYAGILYSDSPEYAEILVSQVQVFDPAHQRTEISIENHYAKY